jgi:NAD-dependent DNA ligase
MQVVLTGPATGINGEAILRDDLVAACKKANIAVVSAVKPGVMFLVASRKDTKKAHAALAMGVAVITYPEMIGALLKVGVTVTKSGAAPNPFTDQVPSTGYGSQL